MIKKSCDYDFIVIGGGIIGMQCAWQIHLSNPDKKIAIIDKNPYAYDNTSCGNMGGFATCEVQPLATVQNMFRAIKWMVDPLAPFTLRPTKIPTFLPWMLGFVKAALTPGHYDKVVKAQELLMSRAYAAHLDVIGNTSLVNLISKKGALCIYRSKERMDRDWNTRWRLFKERGGETRILSQLELQESLPQLNKDITLAIEVPSILHWKDPTALLRGLQDMTRNAGIKIHQAMVEEIKPVANNKVIIRCNSDYQIKASKVIVAAGAWSAILCEQVGDRIPLNTERGYSTTLPASNVKVDNLLLFPDDEFVATPMKMGLRVGGTVELAGLDAPPNYRRTDALVENIKLYFPEVKTEGRTVWMGHRPSMPDGLPIISQSTRYKNIFYAFGHGHVGVTQSAITGKIIADLVVNKVPDFDVSSFSVARH